MVVRFDLEDGREAVADVDRAGVLARPLKHARAFGRQRLQMHARALVAAVLRPHDREQAELGQIRLAADELDDARVFVGRDAVALERRGIESSARRIARGRAARAFNDRLEQRRPSALPSTSSQARSGCGIRPTTFRASLQMPAMLLSEPFGFASSVASPPASA